MREGKPFADQQELPSYHGMTNEGRSDMLAILPRGHSDRTRNDGLESCVKERPWKNAVDTGDELTEPFKFAVSNSREKPVL